MSDTDQNAIRLTPEGRLLIATLNRPPHHLLVTETFEALNACLSAFLAGEFDLLLITASGSFFSKGFDRQLMQSCKDPASFRQGLALMNDVLTRLAHSPKPVIAAINGHCFGGGLELALACHLRLCAQKVRIGLPEIWGGIVPGLGGIHRLTRLLGQAKALELMALGDLVTADEALRLNLVNRVLPRENFMSHVRAFAGALLTVNQDCMRELIRLVGNDSHRSESENLREGAESFSRMAAWLVPPER